MFNFLKNKNKVVQDIDPSAVEGYETINGSEPYQEEEPLKTYTVEFNKLSNNEKEVYGFTLEFLRLFDPTNREVVSDFQLDFVNNEDIDYLIDALQQLKEK